MAKQFKRKVRKGVRRYNRVAVKRAARFHRTSAKRADVISKLHITDTIDLIDNKRIIRRLK